MLDIVIRNARLVDGTGAPSRMGDLGVKDGRIAAIGAVDEPARRTIDAKGRVLSPGFVDIHTHYDAQLFWDPTLSPSSYHGVTTVLAGNCGFSIAPLSKQMAPYLLRMLARVEGMPEESLAQGVPWDWETFAEYLSRVDGKVGLNIGFMCGHTALRLAVMGERGRQAEATADEIERMQAMLSASIAAGALGFSSTISSTHNDAEGQPVPSRRASREELLALARVCRDHPGTLLEFLPGINPFGEMELNLMADMSVAAGRSLNWNAVNVSPGNDDFVANQLSASDFARRAGGEVVGLALVATPTVRINLRSGFLLDSFEGWTEVLALPLEARKAALRDPAQREALARASAAGGGAARNFLRWEDYVVVSSGDTSLEGKRVGDVAQARGTSPLDTFIDIALADDLGTVFLGPHAKDDEALWRRRAELWRDGRTVIGASDAGAHLDMIDSFSYSTQLLAAARQHELLAVEEVVHCLTEAPARLMGLKERGVLKEGWRADLTMFDPASVGSGPVHVRHDLPGGQMRLYADAVGIDLVVVNGEIIVEGGAHTGALPGRVIRSGRDTETIRPAGAPSLAEPVA